MREVDTADAVHSCFFSKGVFRDALILEIFSPCEPVGAFITICIFPGKLLLATELAVDVLINASSVMTFPTNLSGGKPFKEPNASVDVPL